MRTVLAIMLLALAMCQGHQTPIKEEPRFGIDELLELLRGVVEAWEISNEEVERLLICVSDLKDIEVQVIKIRDIITNLDFKDWIKLAGQIRNLFVCIQIIFKDVEPCIDSSSELYKIIQKLIPTSAIDFLIKLIYNIMNHGKEILKAFEGLQKAWKDLDYRNLGFYIGEIIEFILLQKEQRS